MPNWCNNNIELSHPDKAMVERAAKAFADGTLLNEFIPLPKELEDTTAPARESNEALVAKYVVVATVWRVPNDLSGYWAAYAANTVAGLPSCRKSPR